MLKLSAYNRNRDKVVESRLLGSFAAVIVGFKVGVSPPKVRGLKSVSNTVIMGEKAVIISLSFLEGKNVISLLLSGQQKAWSPFYFKYEGGVNNHGSNLNGIIESCFLHPFPES